MFSGGSTDGIVLAKRAQQEDRLNPQRFCPSFVEIILTRSRPYCEQIIAFVSKRGRAILEWLTVSFDPNTAASTTTTMGIIIKITRKKRDKP